MFPSQRRKGRKENLQIDLLFFAPLRLCEGNLFREPLFPKLSR